MVEFIALRSKMYSWVFKKNGEESEQKLISKQKKAKGIQKDQLKNNIRHKYYYYALFEGETIGVKVNRFKNDKHVISNYFDADKIGLTSKDNKRLYLPGNPFDAYSYGYI